MAKRIIKIIPTRDNVTNTEESVAQAFMTEIELKRQKIKQLKQEISNTKSECENYLNALRIV